MVFTRPSKAYLWLSDFATNILSVIHYVSFNKCISTRKITAYIRKGLECCQYLNAMTEYGDKFCILFVRIFEVRLKQIPFHINCVWCLLLKLKPTGISSVALSPKHVCHAWRLTHCEKNGKDFISIFCNQLMLQLKLMRFTYKSKQLFREWIYFMQMKLAKFPLSHSLLSVVLKVNCL